MNSFLSMHRSEIPHGTRGLCWPTRSCASHQSGVPTGETGWNRWAYLMLLLSLTQRMPDISNAWPGLFMTAPCWWACGQNFLALGPGAQCWRGCSDTSIGATMMQLIAHHRHLVPGIMKNGCRHCIVWAASVDENGHHSPVGGLKAAFFDAFRCWCMTDNHRPHLPTRPQDVHMRQHYSLFLPRGVTVVP